MNNNNKLGLVDNLNQENIKEQYAQEEYNDARPPVEASQPTINPNQNIPGFNFGNPTIDKGSGWTEGGTILQSNTYNITESGVQEIHSYSHNQYEQEERRLRLEEQDIINSRKSIFMTPPETGGAPSLSDEPDKPTEEQLTELHKKDRVNVLTNRLKELTFNRQQARTKLTRLEEMISDLTNELEKMN